MRADESLRAIHRRAWDSLLTGARVAIEPSSFARDPSGTTPWIVQVVSVTRTVDAHGALLSGRPQHIDEWVSPRAGKDYDEYAAAVFARVLARR